MEETKVLIQYTSIYVNLSNVIPSFFNKADFWAMLLPGYVTVILGIILFFPTVILGNKSIPFEVFSVVIFIVAGPAVGFALWQIYFHIASFAQFDKDIFNIKYEFQREYERLRLVCDDKERAELDSLDGRHIFGNSTAIGLAIIGLYALGLLYPFLLSGHSTNCMYLMADKDSILCKNTQQALLIIAFILILGSILALGAHFDNKRVRLVVICKLIDKYRFGHPEYHLESTMTCRRRMSKLEYRKKKLACRIIREYLEDRKIEGERGTLQKTDLIRRLTDSDKFDDEHIADNIIEELIKTKVLDLNAPECVDSKVLDLNKCIDCKKLKTKEGQKTPIKRIIRSFKLLRRRLNRLEKVGLVAGIVFGAIGTITFFLGNDFVIPFLWRGVILVGGIIVMLLSLFAHRIPRISLQSQVHKQNT